MRSDLLALGPALPDATALTAAVGRRRFLLGGLAAGGWLTASLTGCGGGGWDDDAMLRAVNATVDQAGVDLRFNDWLFARAVGYGGNVSDYASHSLWSLGAAGRFAAARSGQTVVLASASHTLLADAATSVVLMGSQNTGLRLLTIDENAPRPGGTVVRLRLLHAWPGGGALDCHFTSVDQSLAGRAPERVLGAYGDLSLFGTLGPAPRLRITPTGQPGSVLFDNPVTGLAANQVLTLVVAPAPGAARVAVTVLPHDSAGYVLANRGAGFF
jgi:Domain of unknown function (DUF4397)